MKSKSYKETWLDLNIDFWHKLEISAPNEEYRNEYTAMRLKMFVDRVDKTGNNWKNVLIASLERHKLQNTLAYKKLKNSV